MQRTAARLCYPPGTFKRGFPMTWIVANIRWIMIMSAAVVFAAGADLKPEDIIRSHLERVGPASARSARQNSVAEGQAEIKFLVFGSGSTTGGALFYTQGTKQRMTLTFDNQQYRGEDIVFDGQKFSVAYADTHSYSPLGQFLHTFNGIIKEGLLGSVLST